MNVLLTGALGNVGQSALEELLVKGHAVRCFDLQTRANQRAARRLERRFAGLPGRMHPAWGDLRRDQDLVQAVRGQDAVVHLAFIIPKLSATGVESERRPDWAREINVGGTCNLIHVLKSQPRPPRLLFASSYHIYGQTQDQIPPRTLADSLSPIEHYAHHKVECEKLVRTSGLQWVIIRLAAALPLAMKLDPGMFDIPLNNRMEFVHTRDVGRAIANAVDHPNVWRRTLLIGGGPRCQYYYREIAEQVLGGLGVGMLPEEAFGTTPFPTDWLDTTESQALLRFQQRDLGDYVQDMRRLLGPRRFFIWLCRPLVRHQLLKRSSHWRESRRRRVSVRARDLHVTGAA
jgi:nucleoside-diphosphate-sugar epimerase